MSAVEDKIRKLLRVASCSAASEAERELALQTAVKLASEHAIELDQLGEQALNFGLSELGVYGSSLPPWVQPVTEVVQRHFNVRILYQCVPGLANKVQAFGCQASRQVAEYVYTFLRREFLLRRRAVEMNIRRELTFSESGKFYRGVSFGLSRKLAASVPQQNAMIRIDAQLDAAFQQHCGDVPDKKQRARDLLREGVEAGESIDIRPAIAGPQVLRLN